MKAVIIGASGLVGGHMVQGLLKDHSCEEIIVLSRRPMETQNPKLINKVVNFEKPDELRNSFDTADVIFSTVGTTWRKVDNDEAYRKVDYSIPVNIGKIGLEKGVRQYILVSVVGADRNAGNFYLQLKGEVELAICSLGYESLYILRPSMLLGKRNEFRLGESIGKAVMRSASVLFFGHMRKYYPVKAKQVANAMIAASRDCWPGEHFLHYDEIMKLNERLVMH